MSGIVYIVSAPSGSGKTTLTNELLKSVPELQFSISYTTRTPRGSETHGREYFFVSRENFEEMIARGEFLEYACVFGDYYGTARSFLDDACARDKDLLLDIDVQGAAQVMAKLPDAVSIFIMPPSRQELEQRLRRRSDAEKGVPETVIRRRLERAAKEIENCWNYSYILVNDRLEESIDAFKAIVIAERLRRSGAKLTVDEQKVLNAAERCRVPNLNEQVRSALRSFDIEVPVGEVGRRV
jgi:guanylate kinase